MNLEELSKKEFEVFISLATREYIVQAWYSLYKEGRFSCNEMLLGIISTLLEQNKELCGRLVELSRINMTEHLKAKFVDIFKDKESQ
jgi:hypothetical protein